MKQFLTTNGRFPRSNFWIFLLLYLFFSILCAIIGIVHRLPEWLKITNVLGDFALVVVGIIVLIKRWHDLDKSGWWVLINLIPVIGGIWTLVECGFIKGTSGDNRFGPDPLA